jgi:hypothetical protein
MRLLSPCSNSNSRRRADCCSLSNNPDKAQQLSALGVDTHHAIDLAGIDRTGAAGLVS